MDEQLLQALKATADSMSIGDAARKSIQPLPSDVNFYKDILAGTTYIDVSTPKNGSTVLPMIINIHGGAWIYGSRSLNDRYAAALSQHGYAVVSPEYTLAPHGDLKQQINDIFSALHCVATNAHKYGLSLNNVCLTGDSAGGHLALIMACINASAKLSKIYGVKPLSFSFSSVAVSCPIPSLSSLTKYEGANASIMRGLYNIMVGDDPNIKQNCDFYTCAEGLTLPPIFVTSCENDSLAPHSVQLVDYLKRENRVHEFFYLAASESTVENHVFDVAHPEYDSSKRATRAMLNFFNRFKV